MRYLSGSLTVRNFNTTALAISITGISFCITLCFKRIFDFRTTSVVCMILFAILYTANRANCLRYASCLAAGMCGLIYEITTADNLADFPVVGCIGSPYGCRIMRGFCNNCSVFNLYITVAAVCISGLKRQAHRKLYRRQSKRLYLYKSPLRRCER